MMPLMEIVAEILKKKKIAADCPMHGAIFVLIARFVS